MFHQKGEIQSNAVNIKLCFYTNIKDKINKLIKSYVVYQCDQFYSPVSNSKYIGKTKYMCTIRKTCYLQRQFSFQLYLWCKPPIFKNLYCIGNKSFHAYTYGINSIPEDYKLQLQTGIHY